MIKSILLLLVVFSCSLATAQKYAFVPLSTEQGLPQTQVTSICQDDFDYLWIATLGGLAQFNGGDFKTFSSSDGLLNNRITKLSYFDSTLFVGHDGGLTTRKNGTFTIINYPEGDASRNVSDILKFNNRILISSNGGGLYELKNEKIHRIKTDAKPLSRIRDMHEYGNRLYLATKEGVYVTSDLKQFELVPIPEVSYRSVVSSDANLYFIGLTKGVFRSNQNGIEHILKEYPVKRVNGAYVDKTGKMWFNSSEGVVTLDENGEVRQITQETGLPINMVSCFFEDKDQNLWMGSSGKGVFRFPGKMFQYYDVSVGLSSSLMVSGFQDESGSYFLGSYDNGLFTTKMDESSTLHGDNRDAIWAMMNDVDGKHWFGAQTSMFSIDQSTGKVQYYNEENGAPGLKVTSFHKVSPTEMYVGGSEGVTHYANGKFTRVPTAEDIGTTRDFVELDGKVICATNLGLFRIENGTFVRFLGVDDVVYNLELDENNHLWFGTEEGLFRVKNNEIEKIELLDIPSANYINFINLRDNRMFVGTNYGLFVLSDLSEEKPRAIRFGISEGIVDLETNLNSGFFDNSGDFWFGTASGLVRFSLIEMQKATLKPSIQLKDVMVNYASIFSDGKTNLWLNGSEVPEFKHTENNLIFELDGISMSQQNSLRYQFLLDGLNDDWSPPSKSSVFTFTNLSSGDYSLKMRAIDIDGKTSDVIEVPFEILTPIYLRWWFIAIMILILGAILLLIFSARLRQVRVENEKEKLEFKTRLLSLEQQSMNASMNRHFVFNSLNSIQYFINTQDRESANKYLTNFAKLIRKNLDSATSKGNLVTLEDELERIRLYLSLESMRFKNRFDYEINMGEMDTDGIKIPSMLLQPFVENSIIHGILPQEDKKGLITVDVRLVDNLLQITIEDNGIGIKNSLKKKSKVEGDHISKGMEITSKRIELIQKLVNTGISLHGPEQINEENGLINGTRVLLKIPLDNLEIN